MSTWEDRGPDAGAIALVFALGGMAGHEWESLDEMVERALPTTEEPT